MLRFKILKIYNYICKIKVEFRDHFKKRNFYNNLSSVKDKSLIIGYDDNNNDIDVEKLEIWLKDIQKHKSELADLVYNRLYRRYIKPFEYRSTDNVYENEYKNGFAIMASCCLLIETYISFTVKELINTSGKSEECFGYFFATENRFNDFDIDRIAPDKYISGVKIDFNKYKDNFYKNVRCGILHNGETRKTWRIRRDVGKLLTISDNCKIIDANIFLSEMSKVLIEFKKKLFNIEQNPEAWSICKQRLENLILKS